MGLTADEVSKALNEQLPRYHYITGSTTVGVCKNWRWGYKKTFVTSSVIANVNKIIQNLAQARSGEEVSHVHICAMRNLSIFCL